MAFQLVRELESGVVGNYWRIKSALVDCDGNPTVAIYLNLYINKDARDSSKSPILTQAIVLSLSDVDMFYSYDFRACLYKALKEKPEWASALDVFDDPNKRPLVTPVNLTTAYETSINFDLVSMDIFNLPLTYSIVNTPVNGTLSLTDNHCVYTPNVGFHGIDEADYKTNNGEFDSELAHITINVLDTVNRPVANTGQVYTTVNVPVILDLTGSDPNNLSLIPTVTTSPLHGTVQELDGIFTYTPELDYVGGDYFSFAVNNNNLLSNEAIIYITVE
jgi:hypothetical protein